MSSKAQLIEQENTFVAATYKPLPVVLTRGEDVKVWDDEGKEYLDMMSAYSAVNAGHLHPKIVKALNDQLQKLAVVSRSYYTDNLAGFAKKLCDVTKLDMAIPMNTGAEAVETAIKAARQWGYEIKKIPRHQAEIIVVDGNFHGRTISIISFSSEEEYRDNFGPFTPGFVSVPYGDVEALKNAITPNTCAILMEPIQGEAGIKLPPKGYLKQVRELCNEQNVLFALDEIQSGLGRTGKMFAFEHEDAKPDLLILGKALGGGVLPVSAVVGTKEVMEIFIPGSHGSTFGGNPLSCAVGLAAINTIEEENMVKNSAELGAHLLKEFQSINSPLIREVRGVGLWVGVDLDPTKVSARDVCEKMMERGVLSKETHETVIRFAPPLTITKQDIDHAIEIFKDVLREMHV